MRELTRRRKAVLEAQQEQREKLDRRARIDAELMSIVNR